MRLAEMHLVEIDVEKKMHVAETFLPSAQKKVHLVEITKIDFYQMLTLSTTGRNVIFFDIALHSTSCTKGKYNSIGRI